MGLVDSDVGHDSSRVRAAGLQKHAPALPDAMLTSDSPRLGSMHGIAGVALCAVCWSIVTLSAPDSSGTLLAKNESTMQNSSVGFGSFNCTAYETKGMGAMQGEFFRAVNHASMSTGTVEQPHLLSLSYFHFLTIMAFFMGLGKG